MSREPYEEHENVPDPLLLARVTAPLWGTVVVGAGWVTGRWLALPTRPLGPWVGALAGATLTALALFALVVESRAGQRERRPSPPQWSAGRDGR